MSSEKVRETELWKWLRAGVARLQHSDCRAHVCRIETSTLVGYPDVEGCIDGRSFHIELKTVARPKRETTRISPGLSAPQGVWANARANAGGRVFMLLQVGSASEAHRYLIEAGPTYTWSERSTEANLRRSHTRTLKYGACSGKESAGEILLAAAGLLT